MAITINFIWRVFPLVFWSKFRGSIDRLNSGIKNRQNFFPWPIFLIQKIGNDSVNHADSEDTKILVQFPGNPILKFLLNFLNCVGGTHMRGCFIFKIIKRIKLIMLVILVYETKGVYSISCQPTQFSPP